MVNNTIVRVLSSAVMFVIVFVVFILGDAAFYIAVLITALISYSEWLKMTAKKGIIFKVLGNAVILLPNSAMIYIYETDKRVLLWMLFSIWANDIAAYFVGKNLGGPKLCTKISPNKTWTGLIGGVLCSIGVGIIFIYLLGLSSFFSCFIFMPLVPIIANVGDLFESLIKRLCQCKDSGNIIPGHGGVLDRVDSLIFVAPFVAWLLFVLK